MEKGRRHGKYSGIIHGLDHCDWETQVISGHMGKGHTSLMSGEDKSTGIVMGNVVKPMVPETGGKGGLQGRQGAALFGNAGNEEGISETICSFEGVWYISLSRDVKLY